MGQAGLFGLSDLSAHGVGWRNWAGSLISILAAALAHVDGANARGSGAGGAEQCCRCADGISDTARLSRWRNVPMTAEAVVHRPVFATTNSTLCFAT